MAKSLRNGVIPEAAADMSEYRLQYGIPSSSIVSWQEVEMHFPLCNGVEWVGFVDWTIRDFHSYNTEQGTTYNAYLVLDQQNALIDTVKAPYAQDLLRNIAEVTALDAVDWVVCNHAEPDHAGALPEIMAALPNATLVCNEKCRQVLARYFDTSRWKVRIVAAGETLSLGERTLEFVPTPLAHWPESMFTYLPQEKILFSMDAFGQHFASPQRFDDESCLAAALIEAKTYYANILTPYGVPAAKALAAAAKLDIGMIAPSHGVIWRKHLPRILEAYQDWSSGIPRRKVVVLYDSMWDSTAHMAQAVHEGALCAGAEVQLMHLRQSTLTRIATEVFDAAAVAFGSATLNAWMMPMAGAALAYLQGLKPSKKAAVAFGSYGWSRGGPEAVHEALEGLKWELVGPPIKSQYRPTQENLEQCRAAGAQLAALALAAGR